MLKHRAMQRTWLEIDLDVLQHNYDILTSHMQPNTSLIVVVKGDGYGNGAGMAADLLGRNEIVAGLAVASLDEGIELRRRGHDKTILLFCYTPPELAEEIAAHNLTTTLWSAEQARALDAAAKAAGCRVSAHIKLDTGMCRLGVAARRPEHYEAAVAECEAILACEYLDISGIYTHFATSGLLDTEQTDTQFANFKAIVDALEARGHTLPQIHCANSGATMFHPHMHYGLVRSGCMLFGIQCCWSEQVRETATHPMQVRGRIAQIQHLIPGDQIGYDRAYAVTDPMTIAILAAGYGDGIPARIFGTTGPLVNGKVAPVVGISMDQMMIDITDIAGVTAGQIVTFAGADHGTVRDIEQTGAAMGIHPGDFLTGFPRRVPRIYYQGGEIVAVDGLSGPMDVSSTGGHP
ncbi:MAG: alanine racemase [Oscillospiraceae bacterium]|nr:alanine racemase [Oscillospiraceae bacterium]